MNWSTKRWAILIFVLATSIRLLYGMRQGWHRELLDSENFHIAESLSNDGVFGNPYAPCRTGPTIHAAPAFPWWLSFWRGVIPSDWWYPRALFLFGCLSTGLMLALLPWLGATLKLDSRAGPWAGLIGAVMPWFGFTEVAGNWEAGYSALLLVLAAGATRIAWEKRSGPFALGTGLLWGIALLFSPTLVLVLAGCSALEAFRQRTFRTAVWMALGVMMVISPWLIRNYLVFHQFIFLRGNFGLEMRIAFNPDAKATFLEVQQQGRKAYDLHPNVNREICEQVRQMGEPLFHKYQKDLAAQYIRENPSQAARLISQRVFRFWFPDFQQPWRMWMVGAITLAAMVSLLLCLPVYPRAVGWIFSFWLLYPLVYYLATAEDRYRYPLQPMVLLAAGMGLAQIRSISRR